jgi:hypothetical protein
MPVREARRPRVHIDFVVVELVITLSKRDNAMVYKKLNFAGIPTNLLHAALASLLV